MGYVVSIPRSYRYKFNVLCAAVSNSRLQTDEALKIFTRLKGYVGWLITEPTFLETTRLLEQRWCALPERDHVGFPLQRRSFLPKQLRGHAPALQTEGAQKFAADFVAFCDGWALKGMASWELPEPQEPLFGDRPLCVPGNFVHIVLPLHYRLFGSDDLARQIFRCQRELAAKAGIDPSVAGLRHSTFYARMLETAHLERVITLRYGPAKRNPGLVGDMKTAIARAMGRKTSQVDKWRKAISARRNGRPERIPTFRPRS